MVRILHRLVQEVTEFTPVKRTALCLTGHLRNFFAVWPSLESNLIRLLEPDVFAFTWSDTTGMFMHIEDMTHPSYKLGYDPNSPPIPPGYIDEVKKVLKPKKMQVSDPAEFKDLIDDLTVRHRDVEPEWIYHRAKPKFQMVLGRMLCMHLKRAHEMQHGFIYDQVIFTRWDVEHCKPMHICMSDDDLNDNIIVPNVYSYEGLSDIWAAGPSKMMDVYGNILPCLDLVKSTPGFHTNPHQWLESHLRYYGIKYLIKPIPVAIHNRPEVR